MLRGNLARLTEYDQEVTLNKHSSSVFKLVPETQQSLLIQDPEVPGYHRDFARGGQALLLRVQQRADHRERRAAQRPPRIQEEDRHRLQAVWGPHAEEPPRKHGKDEIFRLCIEIRGDAIPKK